MARAELHFHLLPGVGGHGASAEAAARRLLAAGVIEVIASDAHSALRGPALTTGVEAAIACGLSRAAAHRLADVAPARLLNSGIAAPAGVLA